jgi:hypothetical protein
MTELPTSFEQQSGTGTSAAPAPAKPGHGHALITEQQVLMSTAAAVAQPPAKTRRFSYAVHAVASAVAGWLASAAKPPAKRVYAKRHVWMENALMSREMDRL